MYPRQTIPKPQTFCFSDKKNAKKNNKTGLNKKYKKTRWALNCS